jgi:DNA-binding PadR family transcriptional regulator
MEPKAIYRSLIRLHILVGAARAPVSATGFSEKLRERGLTITLRSTHRILSELELKGHLVSKEVNNNRFRRVYIITQKGRLQLRDAKKRIRALIGIFDSNGVA